jgi:virulence factor Mce-like protein
MKRVELLVLAVTAIAVLAGVEIYGLLFGNPGGHTWTAAFTNSRGLLAGNDVRDGGAIVGRVTSITLSRQGTALVHFQLSAGRAAPRADAAASIEPEDLLGDNYMQLSPGSSRAPLAGSIPTSRTVTAPRLDEVLDAFSPQVRDGLQTLFVEAGVALDQRGADIARTSVELRPALDASNAVLSELDTQNGSLARLVPVAERAAAQLATRRADIPTALTGLARTLQATAAVSAPLQSTLGGLPATLARISSTSAQLESAAGAGAAVSRELEPELTALESVIRGLPALTQRVRGAAPGLESAITTATSALASGTPALSELSTAMPVLQRQAPSLATLFSELDAAAPGIAQGFFVDFPDQADESGRQPFDPTADPSRNYWRGAAVFSCEAFGVPVAPGCLTKAIANLARQPPPSSLSQAPSALGRALSSPSKAPASSGKAPASPGQAPASPSPTPASPSQPPSSSSPSPTPPAAKLLQFLLAP